jgi:hypothetical protein
MRAEIVSQRIDRVGKIDGLPQYRTSTKLQINEYLKGGPGPKVITIVDPKLKSSCDVPFEAFRDRQGGFLMAGEFSKGKFETTLCDMLNINRDASGVFQY